MKRVHRLAGWSLVAALLAFCGFNIYERNGFVGATRKPGATYAGCACHGDTSSAAVHVRITGPDSLGLGESAAYRISVFKDSSVAAGFNVAAFFGALTVGDSLEQRWINGELTHAMPKAASGSDTISWIFIYQAPEVSTIDTLYAAGNSVDLSGDPSGDFWNFSENFVVRVGTPTGISGGSAPVASRRLFQNFPNPFNPSTRISYVLERASHVRLSVFDLLGRSVSVLVDQSQQPGLHYVDFDAGGLPAGIYMYRLETGRGSEAGKMIVLK